MSKLLLAAVVSLSVVTGAHAAQGGTKATVYKSPTCGCCEIYVDAMKAHGFDVSVVDTNDTNAIKNQHKIPAELRSCHTTVVGRYVVEGHVPMNIVDRLLAEKPFIQGIALPGMPIGTPGMPGPKRGPFRIHTLPSSSDGKLYAVE